MTYSDLFFDYSNHKPLVWSVSAVLSFLLNTLLSPRRQFAWLFPATHFAPSYSSGFILAVFIQLKKELFKWNQKQFKEAKHLGASIYFFVCMCVCVCVCVWACKWACVWVCVCVYVCVITPFKKHQTLFYHVQLHYESKFFKEGVNCVTRVFSPLKPLDLRLSLTFGGCFEQKNISKIHTIRICLTICRDISNICQTVVLRRHLLITKA